MDPDRLSSSVPETKMDTDPRPEGLFTTEGAAAFMLTESHEFVTNLLSYLPARDLCRCARVCKTWQNISQRLLKGRRHKVTWSCVNALEGCHSNPPHQGHPMALFESDLADCIKTMWSIPSQALLFTEFCRWDQSLHFISSKYKGDGQPDYERIQDLLRDKLPPELSVLCLHTPGVVGTKRNFQLLNESESEGGISSLLLPEMDNVKVHQFIITQKDSKRIFSRDLFQQICGPSEPTDVKCILIFLGPSAKAGRDAVTHLQKDFCDKYENIPVIAGAMVNKVVNTINETQQKMGIGGLVFSGPNVRAASVLLNETIETREQVRKELKPLQSLDISRGETIGFMFACVGRGLHHYQEENVESQVFRECFPNTPLFGLFGNGEIGCSNLLMTKEGDRGRAWQRYRLAELLHGYTTVVVLINVW